MRAAPLIIVSALVACRGAGGETASGGGVRVVSLSPSATEVVAALGATKLLVGVDEYSKFPEEVKALPKVGDYLTPNLEAIIALRPTFVIVDDIHGQTAGALHDHGIATIECQMRALPDVKTALRKVGEKLGKLKEAAEVSAKIDAALDEARAHRPARHPKVLAIIDREARGLGNLDAGAPGSYIDELLATVGGDNVLVASSVAYPKISLEEVLIGEPEIILDLSYTASKEGCAPWREVDVPAVKNGRVFAMNDPFLVGPTPRVEQALEVLGRMIATVPLTTPDQPMTMKTGAGVTGGPHGCMR